MTFNLVLLMLHQRFSNCVTQLLLHDYDRQKLENMKTKYTPNLVTPLNQTPNIFEYCVVRRGSKNKYQKHLSSKKIRLHPQVMTTILVLGSIGQHNWGDQNDHSMSTEIFTVITNKISI